MAPKTDIALVTAFASAASAVDQDYPGGPTLTVTFSID